MKMNKKIQTSIVVMTFTLLSVKLVPTGSRRVSASKLEYPWSGCQEPI